VYFHKRY